MKKITSVLSIALFSMAVFAGNPEKKQAAVDTKSSKMEWIAEKVTGKHWGTVNIKSGTVELEGDQLVGGNFEIDMTSIKVDDIEDKDTNAKLKGHLMSDDFFSVEKHNTSKFVITKVKQKEGKNGNNYEITGDLTIKGITKSLTFPARISMKDNKFKAYASLDVDRTEWDVRYGSGSFFDDLGDRTIYDEFNIKLDITANM
jgi:polyisoprenoid-binding protein YceI